MTSAKPSLLALLPTALFFGLGIGNLWGIAGLFADLGNPQWTWALQIACLGVLVVCLCGVARTWWSLGAAVPLSAIVATSWLFAAPWAAATGKFTTHGWGLWLVVLIVCGLLAYFIAWLIERGRPTNPMPGTSPEQAPGE